MARTLSPTVPANYAERRIIELENFMLSTHLRGPSALAAFNALQDEKNRRPPAPLVTVDPLALKLKAFLRRIDDEITMMRGYPDYWKHHDVKKGD